MKPQELLERRELSAKQLALWSFENFEFDPYAMGTGYAQRDAYAHLMRNAPAFWWEDSMLRLAFASPLPKNYTVPPPPYEPCWMAFRGTDDDAWGYVLFVGSGVPGPFVIAPAKVMEERYPGFTIQSLMDRMLILLASPYITTDFRRPHGKAAIRRVGHEGVHFVTLRQPKQNPKAAMNGHTHIDWQNRWLVRGHYRNQWHPSTKAHETIWIASYVKGPTDKPLREPVYRVAR